MFRIATAVILACAAYGFAHWTQLFLHRRPGVPAGRLMVTGAWLDPDLYVPAGQRHRRHAGAGLGAALVLGFLLMLLMMADVVRPPS